MSSLKDLIAQRKALDAQIEEVRQAERSDALSKALALIAEYELTQMDLFGGTVRAKKVKTATTVAAKYVNPENGKTWSGRGLEPKWIKGKDKSEFLIV